MASQSRRVRSTSRSWSALRLGEAGEELIFGFALGLCGAVELPLAGRCEADDVVAAVGGVALA